MERKRLVADRFKRIWEIAGFIAQQPGRNRSEIADQFHLSERQLQADLNVIRDEIGLPLTRAHGYRFESRDNADQELGLRELCTLFALVSQARSEPEGAPAALEELVARLPQAFPPPFRPLAAKVLALPDDEGFGPGPEIFARLAAALLDQQPIKLYYPARTSVGYLTEPIVDPQILLPHQRSWYLIGWCHQRRRIVMLCLDRLESATTDL